MNLTLLLYRISNKMLTLKADYEMECCEISTSKDTKLAFLFQFGLIPFMKHVSYKLELNGFTINNKELWKLFSISADIDQLHLTRWTLNVNSKLQIDEKIKFRLSTIGLFKSLKQSSTKMLNSRGLKALLDKLKETNLSKTLKKVIVWPNFFEPSKVTKIFNTWGFKVSVTGT